MKIETSKTIILKEKEADVFIELLQELGSNCHFYAELSCNIELESWPILEKMIDAVSD